MPKNGYDFNKSDVADNDASGWMYGWMDDFYHRMTRMIIVVGRQSDLPMLEYRPDVLVVVRCHNGRPMSEWRSNVRVAVQCQSGGLMSV